MLIPVITITELISVGIVDLFEINAIVLSIFVIIFIVKKIRRLIENHHQEERG